MGLPDNAPRRRFWHRRRIVTPTILQMEAVECGAASLAMVLAYFGRWCPLEELRIACGVSRDGSNATNVLKAARTYGLDARGFKMEPEDLRQLPLPLICFWNFNHFLVVEGIRRGKVYLNDPGPGRRKVSFAEFDQSFTGVVLTFDRDEGFQRGGRPPSLVRSMLSRLRGCEVALAFVTFAGLALVVPGLVIPTFARVFVDQVLVAGMHDWFRPLMIGMALTMALQGLLLWLQRYYLLRMATKLALSWASQFFWHVLRLPVEFFNQRHPGDISGRVEINNQVANLIAGQVATTLINALMVCFFAALMWRYDPVLTMIAIGTALASIVALRFVSGQRSEQSQRLLSEAGKLSGVTMGGFQTIETLKSTGSEDDFFNSWAGYHAKVLNAQQELDNSSAMLNTVPPLLMQLNAIAILIVGGYRIMDGQLSIGMLVAFQSLMVSFVGPVNGLVAMGSTLQTMSGDLSRLDDVLRYPVDQRFRDDPVPFDDSSPVRLSGHVELRGISFGYSPLAPPLIEGFDLLLQPGSRVALVGGSGSGKSTVSKLVAGLYEPWQGELLFDGKPRLAWPREVVHSSIAMVDQDVFMFEGRIAENLTMWDDTVAEATMIRAARDAQIHDDISNRPHGYDAVVGEGGRNFSGGQRQRMEIARALALDPTILVLDEATSALDPHTEKAVDDALRSRGCTCLIVAHRLSTIRDCDEIIVMDQGKIVERGTHDQLLASGGYYAELIKAE